MNVASQPSHLQLAGDRLADETALRLQPDPLERLTAYAPSDSSAAVHASTLNHATTSRPSRAAQSLLRLQRQYGNRYVQRVLALARQGEGETQISPEIESSIERARGGGQALETGVRLQMESAFVADFSAVRVHTDSEAHSLNQAVNAVAFTTGQDIFFRDGAYNPGSSGGKELLAHELTHVMQQGGRGGVQGKLELGQAGDSYEQEADSVARQVVAAIDGAGTWQGRSSGDIGSGSVQRQCACGGHTSSGGECEECRQKREPTIARRVMRRARRSLQRQDDGGADGGSADGGTADGGPIGPAGVGGQTDCKLNIYSDPGCPESSLINTCPINQCCPAPLNHFALARKDSTSSFKGSCSGQPLETRPNDPEYPCNWFYKNGIASPDPLFCTKLNCPIPIA